MKELIALYDANVLYPAPLRDLLVYMALADLYQAKWTETIHDEWIRNVLKNRPDLTRAQLERTKGLMDKNVLDSLVYGYEHLIPSLKLPDPNDRHVLAAAIHSKASIIVTYNLKDFPGKVLDKYDIEAQHPDNFLVHIIDTSPETACAAIKKLRTNLKKPPASKEEYFLVLKQQRLAKTVKKLSYFHYLL